MPKRGLSLQNPNKSGKKFNVDAVLEMNNIHELSMFSYKMVLCIIWKS